MHAISRSPPREQVFRGWKGAEAWQRELVSCHIRVINPGRAIGAHLAPVCAENFVAGAKGESQETER